MGILTGYVTTIGKGKEGGTENRRRGERMIYRDREGKREREYGGIY